MSHRGDNSPFRKPNPRRKPRIPGKTRGWWYPASILGILAVCGLIVYLAVSHHG